MHRFQIMLLLTFAVASFIQAGCRHTKPNRHFKLDVCSECKELLKETITPVFDEINNFSQCLEEKVESAPILFDLDLETKVTEEEMLSKLPVFIHQLNVIQQKWEHHSLPHCSHNLDKHLRKILCLLRGGNKKKQSCISKLRLEKPKLGRGHVTDYTENYIRQVYSTMHGFVNSL